MENSKYDRFKEEAEKTKESTIKHKEKLIENLTSLVESLKKFIRFIDQKIEVKREYYFDTGNRVYAPAIEYTDTGILIYANITDHSDLIVNKEGNAHSVNLYSGEMFYLERSGFIHKYERTGNAPIIDYYKKDVKFALKHIESSSISDIINNYYEEIDLEIIILRNIYNVFIEAVEQNPKKIPILKNVMDILKEELDSYEEKMKAQRLEAD